MEYDGANVLIDFDRGLSYICPGAADNDGHIYVKARNGKEPYKYYVSPEGTGGEDLLENNISAIIDSTDNGDFTHLSFQKGTSYDITIRDGCGSTAVQKFKIGDLREVRLAYAVNSVVCVGGNIEFKAMGLPNPTYKWYKPDGTFFSDEQYASIPNASLSDGGIYKVEITTSLCTSQTVELEVPVAVQPVPTLTRSGGDASQFVCRYSNMDEIVYTWGGSATDVEVTGITTTYYVKDMLAKTLTIKGTVNSNLSYTIKTLGGCNEVSASGTLTYKLSPTASVSGTRNQSICLGNSITNIVFTNAASTTDITVTGLPAGVTGSYASNRLTISGTPVVAGTFDYVVTSSSSDPTNPCVSTEYPGTITVGTENLLDLTSEEGTDRQTICKATSGYTYLTKPIVYTWGGMATNVTVTGSLSSSTYYTKNTTAKTITFTRVPAGAGTYDFTITTVGACTPKSLSGSVTTLNTATSGSISITGNTTVCKNSSTILTADYTGTVP